MPILTTVSRNNEKSSVKRIQQNEKEMDRREMGKKKN